MGPGSSLLFMHMLVVADVSLLFSFTFSASVEADSQCLLLLTFSPASHSYLFFSFLPFNLFCCGCNNPKLKKNPHKVLIKYDYRVDHYSKCLNAALVKVNLFGMFWP